MKHLVILPVIAMLLLAPIFVLAQQNVGIGTTTPNANAILDLSSSNKGLLIPRLSLTNTTAVSPLSAFVAGMVVYNTATAGDVTPGYYGCDGTKWVKLATGSGTGWSLTGNSGINPSSNFLGTTDNQDLVFKRNNARAGLVSNTSTSFGANALNPATSSFHNTAFGSGALQGVTTGNGNTAIGSGALGTNISGLENTAMGFNALNFNNSGHFNTGYGSGALFSNSTGHRNTILGASALRNNQAGSNNTVIGSEAGYNAYGSNNVFIGYNAGYNELNGSNKLYIENSDADSTQALIFGNFATNDVRINGKTLAKYVAVNDDTPAILGINNNTDYYGIGVKGIGGWIGVQGESYGLGSDTYFGTKGVSTGVNTGNNYGVLGEAANGSSNYGVYGFSPLGPNNYAGYFEGAVAIGSAFPKKATGYILSVDGKIAAEEVLVDLDADWPDYVFKDDYTLLSLAQVKDHIEAKGHLPNVPSAKEIEDHGLLLGNMNKVLMEKIEELTLYILQQEEKLQNYERRLQKLETQKGK